MRVKTVLHTALCISCFWLSVPDEAYIYDNPDVLMTRVVFRLTCLGYMDVTYAVL